MADPLTLNLQHVLMLRKHYTFALCRIRQALGTGALVCELPQVDAGLKSCLVLTFARFFPLHMHIVQMQVNSVAYACTRILAGGFVKGMWAAA